jgi:hypothetical protein
MALTILGVTRDKRTDTPVVYAKMPMATYLQVVGDDFENFSIQRRRETHKAYQRLKSDLREGALLPAISLAAKPDGVPDLIEVLTQCEASQNWAALEARLSDGGAVDILDGLQRTYIMRDIAQEGQGFVDGQEVLAEFWLEGDLKNLIYRIIVLNAGQKPMSMRHQIELLFMSLKSHLENEIDGLEIYTERDNTRRRRSKKFSLALIASGYHAFLSASAELKKDNIVASQMLESNALDASKEELGDSFDHFVTYLRKLTEIDAEIFRVYGGVAAGDDDDLANGPSTPNWAADENVFVSFFAAIAQFSKVDERRERVDQSLDKMNADLAAANVGDDPVRLADFDRLKAGANPRKSNVGVATRRLISNGFKEYFRESGALSFDQCWELGAD